MRLGTTYLCVQDIDQSLQFYKSLLQEDPIYANDDRWVTFACGNSFSLYNRHYDEKLLEASEKNCCNQAYQDQFYRSITNDSRENNSMILNFEVEDLEAEYKRVIALNLGEVSELMYVNFHMSYWYFTIRDLDGNLLEITGLME